MGLFDMLQKAMASAKTAKDPFEDAVVKEYFEIICAMRNVLYSVGSEPTTGNVKAKNYIEHFLGAPCDEEKLQRTLELYNLSRNDNPSDEVAKIASKFRMELFERSKTEKSKYWMDRYEAFEKFCQDEISKAEKAYQNVLDVIKDNVNYKHFAQGMNNMEGGRIVKELVIAKSFLEGNSITKEIVLEYLFDSYVRRSNDEEFNARYDHRDDIALLILKALHFEKNGGDKEKYVTVDDEAYRDFVLNVGYYKKAIDDHPFEKEKYIETFVEHIKKSKIFNGLYTSFGLKSFHIGSVNDYFCDAVCNLAWKEIAQSNNWKRGDEDISNSQNLQDVFDIICTYFENE